MPILAGQIQSGGGVKIDSGDSTTVQKTEYTAPLFAAKRNFLSLPTFYPMVKLQSVKQTQRRHTLRGNTMSETAGTTPVMSSRRIAEECVEFARQNGACPSQEDPTVLVNRRATLRIAFAHHLVYSPHSTLSEDCIKPARMVDVSLEGIGLLCCEGLTEGKQIHVRLPQLAGKTAWVKGRVAHSRPEDEHYRVGIAFILDQD